MSMLSRLATMGGAGRPDPSFVSSSINRSNTVSNSVSAPTGIVDGYLLLAVGYSENTSAAPVTVPSGFALLTTVVATNGVYFVATKIASSESGNYTFTWSGANVNNTVTVLLYKDATRVNTIGAAQANSSGAGTAPSITPTYRGVQICFFTAEGTPSITTAPSGMTQRAFHSASRPVFAVYDFSPQEAVATSSRSLVWSATVVGEAFQIQVTNEPDVAPEFIASANTQNTSASNSLVINKPAGTVEGDLMIAVMASSASTTGWTGATDWVEVVDQGGTRPSLRVAYKVAGSSEGSSYTFTSATSRTLAGCIITYRYAAYDTINGSITTAANPLVLPSIAISFSQSVLIACGARDSASITLGTPTSMTARVTNNDATVPSYIVCDQVVHKGETETRSMSTGSVTDVAGIMLAIKPTRSL